MGRQRSNHHQDLRPDLTIQVREGRAGGRTALSFVLGAEKFGPQVVRTEPREFFQSFFRDIENLAGGVAVQERLKARGADLARELLPPPLPERLWELQSRDKSLWIVSDEGWIPWELLVLSRPTESGSVTGQFLCETFALTRWQPDRRPHLHLPLRKLALVVTEDCDLPAVAKERNDVKALAGAGRTVREVPARYEDVTEAMAEGTFDGWHFAGHGVADGEDPYVLGIRLPGDEALTKLTPKDLAGDAANLGRCRPLVLLNACRTGQGAASLIRVGGWASAFLDAGAGAFIGTSWAISDQAAGEFARSFYRKFLRGGLPIGEAVHQARLDVKQKFPDDPSWLAYSVYADPRASIQPGSVDRPKRRSRRRALVPLLMLLLVLAVVIGGLGWWLRPQPRPVVAVLDLEQTPAKYEPWLSTAIPELVHEHLAAGDRIRAIDRTVVAEARRTLSRRGQVTEEEALEFWRLNLGADYLVDGMFEQAGAAELAIRFRLRSTRTGTVDGLESPLVQSEADYPRIAHQAAARITSLLTGSALTAEQQRAARVSFPAPEVASLYVAGLREYRDFHVSRAAELLQQAVTTPGGDHPRVRLALARALADLMREQEAAQQLAAAVAGAGQLSRRQRLEIEAENLAFADDWRAAVTIYDELYRTSPGQVVFCVERARLRVYAQPDRALEILAECRDASDAILSGILIDLVAADAHFEKANVKKAQDLVRHAADSAEKAGWFYDLAIARLQELTYASELDDGETVILKIQDLEDAFNLGGSLRGLFSACVHKGVDFTAVQRFELAKKVLERCRDFSEARGYRAGDAVVGLNLGPVLSELGKAAEAVAELEEARETFEELNAMHEAAEAAANIGYVYHQGFQLAAAWQFYHDAATEFRGRGDGYDYATTVTNMGEVLFAAGFLEESQRMFRYAVDFQEEAGFDELDVAYARFRLAEVFTAQRKFEQAQRLYDDALSGLESHPEFSGEARLGRARLELALGNDERAESAAAKAAEELLAAGRSGLATLAQIAQARIMIERGRTSESFQ
ncbi:MAG: CHAT domain-containing protein, partial [bacterium]|nr:CHAT domain-containing protein [bacterium]